MFAFPGHFGFGLILAGLTNLDAVLVLIGSLLPDLDSILVLFGIPYRKAHRTFFHSIFVPSILYLVSPALALGFIGHLFVDLWFYPGIKILLPFSEREFYFYKGDFKKYHKPKVFLKEALANKRLIAFDVSLFIMGLITYFFF